jgi:ADP-heptose:LPS heptosyltransferase
MTVIAPFCEFDQEKEWGLYSELIKAINDDIVILGSFNEYKRLFILNGAIDLRGRLSVSDSIKTIKNANLFIGNDGGLYHIASYLGIKTIVIFMKPDNFFRVAHLNKPNVKVLWRPTLTEVIQNL